MRLRDVIPSEALGRKNSDKPYFKHLKRTVIQVHEGNFENIFSHKNIVMTWELDNGILVGWNKARWESSFPIKKKLAVHYSQLYVMKGVDGVERIAAMTYMRGTAAIFKIAGEPLRQRFETAELIRMRQAGTFREATKAEQAEYLLSR